jgi:long-chain fatty acid transport protein
MSNAINNKSMNNFANVPQTLATVSAKALAAAGATVIAVASSNAFGGSFQLQENDAASLATAHANRAEAGSITAMTTNPGALAFAPKSDTGRYFSFSVSPIVFKAKFVNNGSISAVGTPLTGGNSSGGTSTPVPATYAAIDLANNLRLGVGITVPYALTTEWDNNWVGRYFALRSSLRTIDINPNLAFKINDNVALGMGFSAQRADVELSRALDFGAICFAALGAQLGPAQGQATCSQALVLPQTRDGKVTIKGDDWSYGFNLGAMFKFGDTRMGLGYRSAITHNITGTARYEKPTLPGALNAITQTPSTTDGNASADLKLPAVTSLSVFHQIDPKWAVMGDVSHTTWSRFKEIRVRFANGAADSVSDQNYKNTTRVSVGTSYVASANTALRAGLAWDPSPVNDERRSPLVPDNDRFWVAVGASFKPSSDMSVDAGITRLIVKEPSSGLRESGAGVLRGRYEDTGATIFSVQLSKSF